MTPRPPKGQTRRDYTKWGIFLLWMIQIQEQKSKGNLSLVIASSRSKSQVLDSTPTFLLVVAIVTEKRANKRTILSPIWVQQLVGLMSKTICERSISSLHRSLVRVTVNVKVIKLPSHTWSILIVLMIMDSRTQSYYKPIVTDYSLITRSLWLSDKPDRIGSNAEIHVGQ